MQSSCLNPTLFRESMLRRLCGITIACVGISACESEPPLSYPVVETKFAAADRKVYWLDNNRILFLGFVSGKKPTRTGDELQARRALFIWNVETNEIKKYRDVKQLACFARGEIRYDLKSESTWIDGEEYRIARRLQGPLGKEELTTTTFPKDLRKRKKVEYGKNYFNQFECRNFKRPDSMADRIMIPLRLEHGYLDFGVGAGTKDDFELLGTLVKPTGVRVETELPYKAISREFKYYPFRQSYFGMRGTAMPFLDWDINNCKPAWWLWPDGRSKQICIPYGPWSTPTLNVSAHPTRRGIFLRRYDPKSMYSVGKNSGGYLLYENGEWEKVMNGLIEDVAVSPDGCRIGFIHLKNLEARRIGGAGMVTIRVIDVCAD